MVLPLNCNWDVKQKIKLASDTNERKSIISAAEFYSDTIGVSSTAGQQFNVVMPIPTSLDSTSKYLPLDFINAGISMSYQLNPANRVLSAGSYSISNFSVVCALITPSNEFLSKIARGLQNNSSMKIPLTLSKSFSPKTSTDSEQVLPYNAGISLV